MGVENVNSFSNIVQNGISQEKDGGKRMKYDMTQPLAMPTSATVDRKVLVIYTGGTIGMVKNEAGALEPKIGAFEKLIRTFPQLHDEQYLRMRLEDINCRPDLDLVLPLVNDTQERIFYKINEYPNLMDSSNMTAEEWIHIAKDIKDNYDDYDGFVVLHGTDTMAYTASALSFMLENLGKCVVITGAQISIFEPRTDGADNFVSSLLIAGSLNIPEVTVYFSNKLFRGNRCRKISAENFFAFDSPNFEPLVWVGIGMEVNTKAIFRPTTIARCHLHDQLSKNVGILRIFPSISVATLRAFLQPPIEGVVLETYGSGNMPSNQAIRQELQAAVERGVIVVNITQCSTGSVTPIYATGKGIKDMGVILGCDMTPEAALTKLAYVLSKDEWTLEKKIKMMETNIRGELTNSQLLKVEDNSLMEALDSCLKMPSPKRLEDITEKVYTTLIFDAIERGDKDAIAKFIDMGADVNASSHDGKTPLHHAVSETQHELIKYLLLNGANVHAKMRNGESALTIAIQYDDLPAIAVLVECGAHLSAPDWVRLAALAWPASRAAHVRRLHTLRRAGADLDATDQMQQTALHKAVMRNHKDAITYLLDNGARQDISDLMGFTPLDYAIRLGYHDIVDILQSSNGS